MPVHNHAYDSEQGVCTVCGYDPERLLEEERTRGIPLTHAQAVKLAGLLGEHDHSLRLLAWGSDGWVSVVPYDEDGEELNSVLLPPQ